MHRLPALAAAAVLVATALTGCAVQGAIPSCPRPAASPDSPLDAVTVDGDDFDTAPRVSVATPFVADKESYEDVITGDGPVLSELNQLVQLRYALISGDTGEQVLVGGGDAGTVPTTSFAEFVGAVPALEDALTCVSQGSRVVVALAPGDIQPAIVASSGIDADQSFVMVIDVVAVYLAAADGAQVFNDARDLPTVVRAPDGRPGVIVPDADPPSDLVVQTLLRGSGPAVGDGDTVTVQYTGVLWDDRTVFDSSWDGAPASFTLDGVIPGFAAALKGATVGSQVLAVIPPDQAYGDQDSGAVPANSTLVFVIDILGTEPAAAAG